MTGRELLIRTYRKKQSEAIGCSTIFNRLLRLTILADRTAHTTMLSVVLEIRVQTEFTIAELATVITHWFIHDAAIVPVVAFKLNHFVIDADD